MSGGDSVRSIVHRIQDELRSGDVLPARARDILMTLSSLLGNCNAELTEAEIAYNEVLLRFLDSDEAANRAKIRAATTQEYRRRREASDTHELVVEMIRSIKIVVRSVDTEMSLQR